MRKLLITLNLSITLKLMVFCSMYLFLESLIKPRFTLNSILINLIAYLGSYSLGHFLFRNRLQVDLMDKNLSFMITNLLFILLFILFIAFMDFLWLKTFNSSLSTCLTLNKRNKNKLTHKTYSIILFIILLIL